MLQGIDVSSYQPGNYDTTGLSFVFIKVTQGLGYENPEWVVQRQQARNAGLVTGFYHYPNIANSATAEADYFLSRINLRSGDILCLDWEWYGQNVSDQQARDYKDAWIAHVRSQAPGHRVIVYSDKNNWTTVDQNSNCGDGLWIATGGLSAGQPGIQHRWAFHQYTDRPQDQDVANPALFPTLDALKAWARLSTPTPTPSPSPQEVEMPSFTVQSKAAQPNGAGVTFARGSARNVSFFCDNTRYGGPNDPGATLRVVIWESDKPPHVLEGKDAVVVTNKDGNQTTINFPNPAMTHCVSVEREDSATFPVFGEVS